jgi:hypothetical protein
LFNYKGTYKAWSILGSEFRQIRRGTGQGDFVWDRMQRSDSDWQLLVEALWGYQYVRYPCRLTEELSDTLYYECQGITHFAVILFMLAQVRAITTGVEKITVSIIKSVAKDCLRTARKILNALKSGNLEDLKNCEDVLAIDIEKFICEESDKFIEENVKGEVIKEATSLTQNFETKQSIASDKNIDNSSSIKSRKKSQSSPKKPIEKGDLLSILDKALSRGISGYQAFKEAGYIKAATEHLDEVWEETGT